MLWKTTILVALLVLSTSVAAQETDDKALSRALLTELGEKLSSVPDSLETCQAVLKSLKAWQQDELNKLDAPKSKLRITEPLDGAKVDPRPMVKGTVDDPSADVWVIIHPMEVADYWVQPRLTVRENGTWRVSAYVGREGMDIGQEFEVMAVANPKSTLTEGMKLGGWPEAEWKSQIVDVTRK